MGLGLVALSLAPPSGRAMELIFSGGQPGFPPPQHFQSDGETPIPVDSGFFFELVKETLAGDPAVLVKEKKRIEEKLKRMAEVTESVKAAESREFLDFAAPYLVEMASYLYRLALYLPVADRHEDARPLFDFFLGESGVKLDYLAERIHRLTEQYGAGIGILKRQFVAG